MAAWALLWALWLLLARPGETAVLATPLGGRASNEAAACTQAMPQVPAPRASRAQRVPAILPPNLSAQ